MTYDFLARIPYVELTIPAWQMVLFVVMISVFMLARRYKLCLITTYMFTFYWGFFLYWTEFVRSIGSFPLAETLYVLFGLMILVFTLVAYFRED